MRRIFVSIILIGVVVTSHAQALTKEDKKRLKQELKNYMNDLESYHAVMTDIQGRLNSNDTLIKSLRQELKSSTGVIVGRQEAGFVHGGFDGSKGSHRVFPTAFGLEEGMIGVAE